MPIILWIAIALFVIAYLVMGIDLVVTIVLKMPELVNLPRDDEWGWFVIEIMFLLFVIFWFPICLFALATKPWRKKD